jgi:diguanylate cyclase (GGDEF)-like protein
MEAADYLGLSVSAVERAVERGELPNAESFSVDTLEDFLEDQRMRAVMTGKLTMPLQASVDVPSLLSAMVSTPSEREAAEALANEAALLAGARCPAVIVLRIDDVLQTVGLLACSAFDGREALMSGAGVAEYEADLQELHPVLRGTIGGGSRGLVREAAEMLRPILRERTEILTAAFRLRGTTVYPMLRIGAVRWSMVVLHEGDPLEVRPETHDAIEALGIQASIALEAVRLRADVLHRANRAEALYGTARMLARADDSQKLLENIAVQASRLLSSDASVVLIADPALERFQPGAATGLRPETHVWSSTLSADFLAGHAAGMTRPLQVSDATRVSSLVMPKLSDGRETQSAICAPIIHKGTLLGAIEVYSATQRTFSTDDQSLLSAFAHQAAIAIESIETQENRRRALLGAVEALASANEARDGYTGQHCKRLAQLAVLISRSLGFSETEVERIGLGAALHDIGKIAVPDAVLRKPGKLTDEEREVINLHPRTGEEIVARVPELADVARMIGAHQERWDGQGYPRGLAGEDIPIGARIIAVVDTYAALTEDRPYRKGSSHADAIRELIRCAGTQLDPAVVDVFVQQQASIRDLMDDTDELGAIEWAPAAGVSRFRSEHPVSGNGTVVQGHDLQPAHNPQLHRVNELAALNDLIRTIASVRDLAVMYEQFGVKLAALVPVDALLILVSEGTPAELRHLPQLRRAPFFPPLGSPAEDGVCGPVARLKRSLWINDYHEYAREREIAQTSGAVDLPSSVIAVPLIVDDEFIGLISVQSLQAGAYDKRHVGLIEEIAIHLALALRNHRALTVDSGREAPPAPTRRLGDRLAALGDLSLVLDAFITEVSQGIPYEGCLLWLLERGEPRLATADGHFSAAEREAYGAFWQARGQGYIWPVIEQGTALIVPDLADDERRMSLLRQPVPGESALVAPLLHKGQVVGVVFLTRTSEPYTAADERAFAVLATPAAAVISDLLLRQQEARRTGDLARVGTVITRALADPQRPKAFSALARALSDVFGFRRISIHEREGKVLALRAQVGYDNPASRAELNARLTALVPQIFRERTSVLNDALADARSEIAVPLTDGEKVRGLILVSAFRERRLDEWDLAVLELIAAQVSQLLASATSSQPPVAASTDSLTGLPDRQAFNLTLAAEIERARNAGQPVSLLFCDLDHFKAANDAFGHRLGDELLGWVGGELPKHLPPGTFIARYGGEEFIVLLPTTPSDRAEQIAGALRSALAERSYIASNGHRVLMTVSIGVATFSPAMPGIRDGDDLIHAADRAMYLAKRAGRNRVIRWTPELRDSLKYI